MSLLEKKPEQNADQATENKTIHAIGPKILEVRVNFFQDSRRVAQS